MSDVSYNQHYRQRGHIQDENRVPYRGHAMAPMMFLYIGAMLLGLTRMLIAAHAVLRIVRRRFLAVQAVLNPWARRHADLHLG